MSADEITSLPEAVAALGALPMPAGPAPLSPEREAEIREWVEAMGRKKDIRYYGSWQQHGELLGEIDRLRAERAAIGDEIARFGIFGAALPAAKALVKRADELVTENGALRARVAELLAERHSTNEVLDDAVQALRERQAEREALVERMRAGQRWQRGRSPELVSENLVSQSELRSIFGIPLITPWDEPAEVPVPPREDECACPPACRPHQVGCPEDGVPVAALREPEAAPSPSFAERAGRETDPGRRMAWRMLAEPEPEFDAYLHHPYRTGHDLPETGGTQ